MLDGRTRALFVLGKLKGVGPALLRAAFSQSGDATDELSIAASHERLRKIIELDPGSLDAAKRLADDDLAKAARYGAGIVSVFDGTMPVLLSETPDAPAFLYVKGDLSACRRNVAVVGTREPTSHGRATAERITEYLVSEGWSVVSGLALGCDAVAHETAVAHGGRTVAVLAHGLHTVNPKQNAGLAERILLSGGALVSEYPFGTEPSKYSFAARDRLQAGLSSGVVLIQSSLTGGSLIASGAALRYGRVLAVAEPTAADRAAGEKNVQANLVLLGTDESRKLSLLELKSPNGSFGRIVPVRGKGDYPTLSAALATESDAPAGGQARLAF